MSENKKRLSDEDLQSLREWVAGWGDGPNWVDQRGEMVAAAKSTLTQLIEEVARLRGVIADAQSRVLGHRQNRIDQLFKANLGALLNNALDDNRDGYFKEDPNPVMETLGLTGQAWNIDKASRPILSNQDRELIDAALGWLPGDYCDHSCVPRDAITTLRQKILKVR